HHLGPSHAEDLGQSQHNHREIAGHTDRSNRFFSKVSDPIKISQQIKGLHQHARRQKCRHMQQMFGDRALSEILHFTANLLAPSTQACLRGKSRSEAGDGLLFQSISIFSIFGPLSFSHLLIWSPTFSPYMRCEQTIEQPTPSTNLKRASAASRGLVFGLRV